METPLRMLHVFPSFMAGGTELRIIRIANRLDIPAHHTILALNGRFDAAAHFQPGTRYDLVTLDGPSSLPVWLRLRQRLRQTRPDLVLTYNWGAIDAVAAARSLPGCVVVHNESGFTVEEATARKLRRVWARRLLLRGIHKTIVNSRSLLEIALKEYKLPLDKVMLIRNGIDVAQFSPGPDAELRAALGAGPETLVFGFLGRLREEKRLDIMIEAFITANLRDAKLVLFGDGPCRPTLEAMATRLGHHSIIFPGEVKVEAAHYRALDVFAISSATEQTPNALLEAMACGLPAIGTDVGDIKEMLGGDGPAVVPANDVAALARSMRLLAERSDLRAELGAVNRSRAVERYSVARMVTEFSVEYVAAAASRHR